jgi:hypothetical protein
MTLVLSSRFTNPNTRRRAAIRAAHEIDEDALIELLNAHLTEGVRISRYSSAGFHRKSSAHQTTHHPRNEVTQDQHYAPVTSSRVNFRFDFRRLSPASSNR